MKMVCKKTNRYGGKKRAFGDEVEVHRTDVRLVSALGWFAPFTEPKRTAPVKAATKVQARAVAAPPARNPETKEEAVAIAQAALAQVIEPSLEETKPARTYQRRDLTAES